MSFHIPKTLSGRKPDHSLKALGLLAFLVCAITLGVPQVYAGTVYLNSASNIQSYVNAYPTGTTFVLSPGVYRLQSVVPKSYDIFKASGAGVILNGSRLLTSFRQSGSNWVAYVPVSYQTPHSGVCDSAHPVCDYPQDLFFDNHPLQRVPSLSAVGPGRWYLDYSTDDVYVGSNPSGHTVEISELPHAFSGSATGVKIIMLTVEKYASTMNSGAIQSGPRSQGWAVKYCYIQFNHGMGIQINNGMWAYHNKIYMNGQLGIGGSGNSVSVQNNDIGFNNFAGYSHSYGGGSKFTYCNNLLIQYNYAHDNKGPGLWGDVACEWVLFDHNQTTRNQVAGIFYETCYHATIRYNTVTNDGYNTYGSSPWWGAGILVNSSPYVDIYGNTVTDCMNAIFGIQTDRGTGPYGPYLIQHMTVHGNFVTQVSNFAEGIVKASTFDNSVYTSWNNHFQNDTFSLTNLSHPYFYWLGEPWTLTQWDEYSYLH